MAIEPWGVAPLYLRGMHVDLSELSPNQRYGLLTQVVIPRPIAWILSENDDASFNLAPFSYFNVLTSDPPMVVVSIGLKSPGVPKDSRVNIEKRKDFVVHIAHREQLSLMNQSAEGFAANESEVSALGIELLDMPGSRLPRLSGSRLAFSCEFVESKAINDLLLIFAEVKHVFADDSVVGEDAKGRLKIHADKVDPIGRLGGGEYVGFGEILKAPRPR